MNRTTQIRLERLEEAHLLSAIPHRVLSSCPLPDEPASHAVILEWLDEGLAHVAFGGRAVFYDGGQHGVLGLDEWQASYCTKAGIPLMYKSIEAVVPKNSLLLPLERHLRSLT
jgi:hypothetical protein